MRNLLMVLAVLVLASIGFGYTNLQYCDSGDTFTGRTYSVPAATRFYLMDNWPGVGGIESACLKKIWFRFSAPGQLTYEIWDGNILQPITQIVIDFHFYKQCKRVEVYYYFILTRVWGYHLGNIYFGEWSSN